MLDLFKAIPSWGGIRPVLVDNPPYPDVELVNIALSNDPSLGYTIWVVLNTKWCTLCNPGRPILHK
eukprot:2165704-Prorocentrum_lima.AAC.1